MNPNEIKKALECCGIYHNCLDCVYNFSDVSSIACLTSLMTDTLAYINQLEAEVERLKKVEANILDVMRENIEQTKSEAIKEFGKFLIDKSENGVISASDIPDYVVEMVGEG